MSKSTEQHGFRKQRSCETQLLETLNDCINSTCRLFADDCLLYRQIYSKTDSDVLQNDLRIFFRTLGKKMAYAI